MYEEKIISLDSYCMDVPALGFAAWLVQELVRVSSRTYCGCLRTSLRTKTVSFPNFSPNLSPNLHCFHNEWGLSLRISNGCRPFQMRFQIHIIIIISMNIVMSSSKDWSFNQILAYLWSFLSISAFVSMIFCNFAIKQQ